VNHGVYEEKGGEGWAAKAREVIEARIATYPAGSVHFNLLAIRGDPLPELRSHLEAAKAAGETGTAEVLSDQIHLEEQKRSAWAFENSVRSHNHLGLIHALLVGLAQSGGMEKATAAAKAKFQERKEKAKKEAAFEAME